MARILPLFLRCLLLATPLLPAQPGAAEIAEEEGDWLEYYYRNPTPDRFVEMMKNWSDDGTLRDHGAQPAVIGFLSQVLRQNRDRIADWHRDLAGRPPADAMVLSTAMLFSRTGEADAIFEEVTGRKPRDRDRPPKILDLPQAQTATVSMLWGHFYATGSESPIRRIVRCFRFEEAPERPEGVEIPEGYEPFYLRLPRLAYVSLLSNMDRHPRVVEICKTLYHGDAGLHPLEKTNLYDLLSEIEPEQYPRKTENSDP